MDLSKIKEQISFSGVFFDSMFGLILFFSLDSFLTIEKPIHFVFYAFTTIILVHWWLAFKSADDSFGQDVADSALDLVFGIVYIFLLEYAILYAADFEYMTAVLFILALIGIDMIWALVWRYVGKWQTDNRATIRQMERELNNTLLADLIAIVLISGLLLLPVMSAASFVSSFIAIYIFYIVLTFKLKIIDLRIF